MPCQHPVRRRARGLDTAAREQAKWSGDGAVIDSLDELRASRARVVAAADAERRRIERELHDGAQQHLVALVVNLQLARRLLESDPAGANALLEELGRDT